MWQFRALLVSDVVRNLNWIQLEKKNDFVVQLFCLLILMFNDFIFCVSLLLIFLISTNYILRTHIQNNLKLCVTTFKKVVSKMFA